MPIDRRSKHRVETCLEELGEEYGPFERIEQTWPLSSSGYDATVERFKDGTVGGAGVWVINETGEVLMVRQEGESGWSEPAGKAEPGESLTQAARREIEEETNVACTIDGVLVAQVVSTTCAEKPERPPVYRLIVTFDGSYVSGDPEPEDGEIAAVGWWDTHPEELLYEELAELPIPADE